MWLRNYTSILLLLLLLAACSEDQSQELDQDTAIPPASATDIPPTTPVERPTISPTESGLEGMIFSTSPRSQGPLAGVEVHLARVYWNEDRTDGAFMIDETQSPVTFTEDDGKFSFAPIEESDYVIVVGDLYGQNIIISNSDGTAKVFSLDAGRINDVGVLQVDLEAAPTYPATPIEGYPAPVETTTPSSYP